MSSNEHRCQPYQGVQRNDPDFPRIYQTNAWCWSPELGFHRAKDPDRPLPVRVTRSDPRVGPDSMWAEQAMGLGLGEGTNAGDPLAGLSPVLVRTLEVMRHYRGDAEPIALYGYRCRGLSQGLDSNGPARRAVYTDALLRALPAGLGHVDDVLLELAHSAPSPPATPQPPPFTHPCSEAESWANILHRSLDKTSPCHGAMRGIGRIFSSTSPDDAQQVQWLLDTVTSARARLVEHTR